MGMLEAEGTPVHELRGVEAWKAQIRNILVKIDTDTKATPHKTKERIKNLVPLATKVSQWSKSRRLNNLS